MSQHLEEIRDRITALRQLDLNETCPDGMRNYIADLFHTVADELERVDKASARSLRAQGLEQEP